MSLQFDLTSHNTTTDDSWTPNQWLRCTKASVVYISGTVRPQGGKALMKILTLRSFRNSEAANLVVQNSPLRHLFLPFPSPSVVDATLTTPTEFGPLL